MSYGIIFKNIVVRYNDKVLWFERFGCNNDDHGRSDRDYTLKVFNNDNEYINYFSKWLGCEEEQVRMNSKFITLDKYSQNMLKKLNKAITIEDFYNLYSSYFRVVKCFNVKKDNILLETIPEEDFNFYNVKEKYKEMKNVLIWRETKDLSLEEVLSLEDLSKVEIAIYKRKVYKK